MRRKPFVNEHFYTGPCQYITFRKWLLVYIYTNINILYIYMWLPHYIFRNFKVIWYIGTIYHVFMSIIWTILAVYRFSFTISMKSACVSTLCCPRTNLPIPINPIIWRMYIFMPYHIVYKYYQYCGALGAIWAIAIPWKSKTIKRMVPAIVDK